MTERFPAPVPNAIESKLPCVLYEDEHVLVIHKPAGLNTHAPAPFAGEGIYDWLRHREPRWANLAIIHRLDKETSGVMVLGKTALANRSLTEQFTRRAVRKKYLLLTDGQPKPREFTAKSKIIRAGERYVSGATGELAETRFRLLASRPATRNLKWVEAEPLTGRTHQIRVHASENGFPILGDALYGGSPFSRICLHAAELTFEHPFTRQPLTFSALADFTADSRLALRTGLLGAEDTNSFRIIHGASDGWPGWYVEKLGEFLLSQGENSLNENQVAEFERLMKLFSARGAYHKILSRQVRRTAPGQASPRLVLGESALEHFAIRENGFRFELSFNEGYSVGLFLDQRDNRRRLAAGHIAANFPLFNANRETQSPKQLLNVFAYTCGFSVCAASAGIHTTSLDLSKKYLEWGKRNFALNKLPAGEHDFIYGDAFDWMRRLAKKNRAFDVIVLDPPTFSQAKEHGAFRVEKDFGKLVSAALPLLKPEGVLLASTNSAEWKPESFLEVIESAIRNAKRPLLQQHYAPQPPDFPVSRNEPAYLKTIWLRVL